METIEGAELILLAFPDQKETEEFFGGILTIATPMGKNWHWLRREDYSSAGEMTWLACEWAKKLGFDHVNVIECTMNNEYMATNEEDDDEDAADDIEGQIELDA